MWSIPNGYTALAIKGSENIGGMWYNAHDAKLIIQFKASGLHYRYSNVTQNKVDILLNVEGSLDGWVRPNIIQNKAEHPVEKLA